VIIKAATSNEISTIKSYQSIVQQEATMGYIEETNHIPNLNEYFMGPSQYFVLISNGVLCGWVLVGETHHPYKNTQRCGMILELYVFPTFRKYGVGTKLMKYAITYFRNIGILTIQLNVFAGNPARKLYKKLGFRNVATMMEMTL
jgi:ribosomal protein S18 acetylase RimI-like enzyme